MSLAHLIYEHWFITLILVTVPTLVFGEVAQNVIAIWKRK